MSIPPAASYISGPLQLTTASTLDITWLDTLSRLEVVVLTLAQTAALVLE